MTKAIAVRDDKGLTLEHRKILQEIALTGSWEKAADSMNISRRKVRAMFRDEAFKAEYDAIFDSEEMRITLREIEAISGDAPAAYGDAIHAEMFKNVPVVCPSCGHKHTVSVQMIDHATRMKAADTLLKVSGIMKDQRSVKLEATMTRIDVSFSGDEYLAYERLKRGFGVPPHVYDRLSEKAAQMNIELPPNKDTGMSIEGQYRVVEEEPDAADTAQQ